MQNKRYFHRGPFLVTGLLAATGAQAHPLFTEGATLIAGFTHPLLGWDHLLAMLAVGILAVLQRGRLVLGLPLLFLAMMAVGAVVAQAGISLPLIEAGIASSLFVLSLLLAFATRIPILGAAVMVGVFALIHGYAHGIEIPQATSAMPYGFGFLFAAAALISLGAGLGSLCRSTNTLALIRAGGVALGAIGALMWV